MKIGLIAYSTSTGLGYMTYEFARHIKCEAILIVDLHRLNGMPVDHDKFRPFYKHVRIVDGIPTRDDFNWLLAHSSVLYVCETPLNYDLFKMAKEYHVPTVLHYNYEFLNYFRDKSLPAPTVLVDPAGWEEDRVRELAQEIGSSYERLDVPIDTKRITPRVITQATTLTHIAGRPAVHDRNGTGLFLQIAMSLGDKFNYEVFMQSPKERNTEHLFHEIKPLLMEAKEKLGDRITIHFDTFNNADMYRTGSILVMPRKYGGLCIPMIEALSAGMPVIMPNISPNYKKLPNDWLVDADYCGDLETHSKISMYQADGNKMIETIFKVASEMSFNNERAKATANLYTWQRLRPSYQALFKRIMKNEANTLQ